MSKLTNHPYRLEQCIEHRLCNPSEWTIQSASRAGERTGFFIKELKCILDCGLASYRQSTAIFITHSHCDHTLALPMLVCGRNKIAKGQEHLRGRPVYCPEQVMYKIHLLNRAVYELSYDDINSNREVPIEELETRQGYQLFGVQPNPDVYLDVPGLDNIKVEVLTAYHSNMNCVGYGFNKLTRKLKEDFNHLKGSKEGGQEIKRLKEEGVAIYDTQCIPELAFYCDSSIHNLSLHDEWKKYPVIICECTGYPGYQRPEQMTERDHSHLDLLKPIMLENPEKQWILIHASMGVSKEVLKTTEEALQLEGLNIIIWCSE